MLASAFKMVDWFVDDKCWYKFWLDAFIVVIRKNCFVLGLLFLGKTSTVVIWCLCDFCCFLQFSVTRIWVFQIVCFYYFSPLFYSPWSGVPVHSKFLHAFLHFEIKRYFLLVNKLAWHLFLYLLYIQKNYVVWKLVKYFYICIYTF